MTIAIHSVRNRRAPAGLLHTATHLKEPAVRSGYLAGMSIARLAEAFGVTEFAMRDYISARRRAWAAMEHRGIREDERRTVTFARAARDTGSYDLRPISVPRITMHVKAMAAPSEALAKEGGL